MTKLPFLKLDLQKFAETDPPADPPKDKTDEDDPGADERKKPKYSDDDVDALFDKKFAKLKKQWDEEQARAKEEADKDKKEAERLAKMTIEEKSELEKDKLRKAKEALEKENNFLKMSRQVATMLAEKKITATDALLEVLVKDTAEATQIVVNDFIQLVSEHVADGVKGALAGTPPKANTPPTTTENPFAKSTFNLTKQAQLKKDNPELYASMKAQASKK
jgi:hypothetical protein